MTGVMENRSSSRAQSGVSRSGRSLPMIEVDPAKLPMAPDPSKVGTLKYPRLTHEKVDTKPVKNIEMKQYLGVKHALPKTRLTNAILYENVSQDRHLEMKMRSIASSKGRSSNTMDFNRRAFVAQQERKRRKWKREDEVRLSGMNLPSLSPAEVDRRPNADVMYHSSGNDVSGRGSISCGRKPILPMMKVRRERTEIILHNDRTFITKLPTFVQIDENIEKIFDAYRGTAFLARDLPSRDERFTRLQRSLQSSLTPTEDPQSAYEHSLARGRVVKIKNSATGSPTNSEPAINQHTEARVMIASRGKSRDMARSAPAVDFVTEKKSAGLNRSDIIQSFKTQDIKELSKSLTRESQIEPDDLKEPESERPKREKSILKPPQSQAADVTSTREVTSLGVQYKIKPQ